VKADDLLDDFRKVWAGNKVIPESGHVRFESLADICSAKGHVRFAPIATAKADFPQTVMSALPPKADMCGAAIDVRFGPRADFGEIPGRS
jgi:hypothetical protein